MTEDIMKMAKEMLAKSQKMADVSNIASRKLITVDGIYFVFEEDKALKQEITIGIKEENEYQDIEKRVKVKRAIFIDTILSFSETDESGICDITTNMGTFSIYSTFEELAQKIKDAC